MAGPQKNGDTPGKARRQSKAVSAPSKYANGADKSSVNGVKRANGATAHAAGKTAHHVAGNGASPPSHCDAKGKPFGERSASVLGRNWRRYEELGYSPIGTHPIGTTIKGVDRSKTPIVYRWQRFCDERAEPLEIKMTLDLQPRAQIGICGGYGDFIALDVDTENSEIKKIIEEFMDAHFPDAPRRIGNPKRVGAYLCVWETEGEKRSARYVDENDKTVFELIGKGRQIVMPPSLHPLGTPYRFADGEELPPPISELPRLTAQHLKVLVHRIRAAGFTIVEKCSADATALPTPEELRVYEKLIPAKEAVALTVKFLKTRAKISIEKQHGHDNAVLVWQKCGDLGCPPEHITNLMWAYWSQRCDPPWTSYEALEAEVAGVINSRRSPIGINNPDRIAAQYFEQIDDDGGDGEPMKSKATDETADSVTSDKKSDGKKTISSLFDPWERYAVPDFPFDVLPPDVERFVETHSMIIGCDASALAMCVMTAFSSALDHRFALKMMRNGDFHVSPRLWTLLVGDPSVKKTPTQRAALAPLWAHEDRLQDAHKKEIAAHEAMEGKAKDAPPEPHRRMSTDVTPEKLGEMLSRHDRGMLVTRDEVSGWIGSMEKYSSCRGGASDRAFWLQAFDGGSYIVDRISRKAHVRNLSISLLGGIQPDRLAQLHGLTSDGLLQRFIPVIMRSSKFTEDMDDDGSKIAYAKIVDQCISAPPATLRMTDAAMEAMNRLRRHIHDLEVSSGGFADGFQGFVGKLAGAAGTLALILHLIKGDGPHAQALSAVDVETVEHVDRIIRDFVLPHAFEFYRTSEAATDGDRLQRIASWILTTRKERIVSSHLTSGVRLLRGMSLAKVNDCLSPLIAGGWLAPEEAGPLNNSWNVNERIWKLFAERADEEERRKQTIAELMNSDRARTAAQQLRSCVDKLATRARTEKADRRKKEMSRSLLVPAYQDCQGVGVAIRSGLSPVTTSLSGISVKARACRRGRRAMSPESG